MLRSSIKFKKALLTAALLGGLLTGFGARAQAPAGAPQAYWFEMQNGTLQLRSANSAKPVTKPVTLPNGARLDYQTKSVVLADGTRQPLREGDTVSLTGVVTSAATAAAAAAPMPAPVVAAAPAPAVALLVAPPAAPAAPATAARFDYASPVPVKGRLKGVVELGSSGFNSFIVRIDPQKRWQLVKAEYGNSLVLENLATGEDVRRGLKAYIGQMLDFGVSGKDVHFVVSSGAQKADVTARIIRTLKELGYRVNAVTPEREAVLGLRTVLPPAFVASAFVVDLGSGNTKLSWLNAKGEPVALETYGAKYYEAGVADEVVAAGVLAKARQVPAVQRKTCFIIGGVPYELAKKLRQDKEPYTVLAAPATYGEPEGAKLKAGLNIYRSIVAATGCEQFVFPWDANFTIGYLLALP